MREIKFRAWDIYDKKMNYFMDDLWQSKLDNENIGPWMQYTGLKDKDGKEIYEGDIMDKQYHNLDINDGIGVVKMGSGFDSDGYCYEKWVGWKCGDSSLADINEKAEVIGNIYENPELIE